MINFSFSMKHTYQNQNLNSDSDTILQNLFCASLQVQIDLLR